MVNTIFLHKGYTHLPTAGQGIKTNGQTPNLSKTLPIFQNLYARVFQHPKIGRIRLVCLDPRPDNPAALKELLDQVEVIMASSTLSPTCFWGQRSPGYNLEQALGLNGKTIDGIQAKGFGYRPLYTTDGWQFPTAKLMREYRGLGMPTESITFDNKTGTFRLTKFPSRPYSAMIFNQAKHEFVSAASLAACTETVTSPFAFLEFLDLRFINRDGIKCEVGAALNFVEGMNRLRGFDYLLSSLRLNDAEKQQSAVIALAATRGRILAKWHDLGFTHRYYHWDNISAPVEFPAAPDKIRVHDFDHVNFSADVSPEHFFALMLLDVAKRFIEPQKAAMTIASMRLAPNKNVIINAFARSNKISQGEAAAVLQYQTNATAAQCFAEQHSASFAFLIGYLMNIFDIKTNYNEATEALPDFIGFVDEDQQHLAEARKIVVETPDAPLARAFLSPMLQRLELAQANALQLKSAPC